ncbi:DNA polymerase III subunit chi [Yunchengibacter salinarum]|uniref:DNA polymerase III subunit chi n=1 Tax=Yunchengibacter salinarum TaxID=3133399 RepID=UPI0035B5BE8B
MSREVRFYHLERQPSHQALVGLMKQVLKAGHRALVRCPDPDSMARLDEALWVQEPDSFLPHGRADGAEPHRQPILLTLGTENPAGADILTLVDGAAPPDDVSDFQRLLVLFDGRNDAVRDSARGQWRHFRDLGFHLSYWRQPESGGWVREREHQPDGQGA